MGMPKDHWFNPETGKIEKKPVKEKSAPKE